MVEWKKLGEVCQVLNGFAFKSSEYVPEGIRIIRISDVQNGYISDKDKVFYPIEKLSEFEKYILNNGDLVMSLTGNPGRVAFIRTESCALNQRVACLRAKTVSNSYLFYLFNCKEFESTAFANSSGGAQKNLSTTWLNNFLIPIPSLSEQQRIVGILDTFTASIDNLKEQIAQRRKQYEYYRDQLLDLEGKPGVEMKTLGEVCKKTNNIKWKQESSNKEYKYIDLSSVCIENNQIEGTVIINKENAPSRAQQVVNLNDVLLGTTRPTLKRYCQINEQYDNQICSTGYCVFRANKSIVLSRWIYHNIGAPNFWDYCEANQKGAGYPCLSNSDAFAYSIPVPSLQEQQRIVSILDTFEASIQNLEAQLKQREKQYEYYRNKLLTFE